MRHDRVLRRRPRPRVAVAVTAVKHEVGIERLEVSAYTVPTDRPESDGTAKWDATTLVLVQAHGGDETGLGYTYGDLASGAVVRSVLADVVEGRDAMSVTSTWEAMARACRNLGRPGV